MRWAHMFLLVALALPRVEAEETSTTDPSSLAMTSAAIEAKMAEVNERVGLVEESRALLVGQYQQALSNLQQASAHAEQAAAFHEATRTAPEQTRMLRAQAEAAMPVAPKGMLGVTDETPLGQIEERIAQGTAELAEAKARQADLQKQLDEATGHPPRIRERLEAIKREQEEVNAALGAAPVAEEDLEVSQARRWNREARSTALAGESQKLEQELISQPARIDLLNVRLDVESAGIERIEDRIESLQNAIHARRLGEAEAAQTEIERTIQKTAGLDPVLDRLAARNQELVQTLNQQASNLVSMATQREKAVKRRERIESDLSHLEGALAAHGRTEGLGQLLVRQRDSLPNFRSYERRERLLAREIAEEGVRHLDHRDEARELAEFDKALATYESQLPVSRRSELHDLLQEALEQRRGLLKQALDGHGFYVAELVRLDSAEKGLLETVRTCDEFLVEHLLWLRSAKPTRWKDLAGLGGEIRRMVDPAVWSEMGQTIRREGASLALFWVVLVVAVVATAKRNVIAERIQGHAVQIGNVRSDRFATTLRAMSETLAAALPWPLLLATLGWNLHWAKPTSTLTDAMGALLLGVALHLYLLRVLSVMCIPRGVAESHFRWPKRDVHLLHMALNRLALVYVPTVLVTGFAIRVAPVEAGGTIARLGLVLWSSALALFFYHVFHPRQGWLAQRRRVPGAGILMRAYPFWCALLMIFPLGLAGLALTGYVYSATMLARMFLQTLGMIAGLIVLHQLTIRSVRILRRRLAYTAAVERRQATLEERNREGAETSPEADSSLTLEEPEADLDALSDDTGELVKMAAIAAGLVGLYVIWEELITALRILNEVTLWKTTLGSIGVALLAVIGTTILARRLPAVLEMLLLRFSELPAGSRHATTTLFTYAIVTTGTLFALHMIGLRWSQFQWLIAALGVGIGFGLQEMVANFISGLIILFERPIRVGDVVTVGDTDGIVTRIRIRATTIRNWDRKELLVPNKEFITGRLLNWTLSDQVTRVVITVGVAYGSDTDKALALMKEAAVENENVLDDPPPMVSFEGFGDNSLSLLLRAYLGDISNRIPTTTELHKAVDRKFKEADIVIAFPQRDVHLDISEPLQLNTGPREEDGTTPRYQDNDPAGRKITS